MWLPRCVVARRLRHPATWRPPPDTAPTSSSSYLDVRAVVGLKPCCGSIMCALQGLGTPCGARWAQRPSKCMPSHSAIGHRCRLRAGVYAGKRSVVLMPSLPPGGCMPRMKYFQSAAVPLLQRWPAQLQASGKLGMQTVEPRSEPLRSEYIGGLLSSRRALPLRLKSINPTEDGAVHPSGLRVLFSHEAHLWHHNAGTPREEFMSTHQRPHLKCRSRRFTCSNPIQSSGVLRSAVPLVESPKFRPRA